ncbi:MAG: hypothetical protein PHR24_04345 [Oscillospiraceae bacterium]|nr:hypothetical protein [Oscillospiraceae bacterium]MDD3832837.1 hypothetical protein [Oscillospiraceae bacterium]MDD4546505.1 hypothetical protein [Oscillospiraceae bacterium]
MLLVIGLTFSLVGCTLGGNIKIGKDGNVKIKGEDGDLEIGKAKWDKSKMFGLDAPKAKLESSMITGDSSVYVFSEMKEKDAEAYTKKIKDSGFTYNTLEMQDFSYTGTNKEGQTISFIYSKDNGGGTLSASQGEKPSEEEEGNHAVIDGTNREWESDKIGGLPDPGKPVTNFWAVDNSACYTFEKMDDYLEYVEEIKSCGFTVDPTVLEINGSYNYSAANQNGDKISFYASDEMSTLTFEKND